MFKRFRRIWSTDLIKPLIHRTFTRVIWGLFIALMLAFLITRAGGRDLRSELLLLWGLLCLIAAWLTHLQMDGAPIPQLQKLRGLIDRKRPARQKGDMIDFVDEEMQTYESLDDEERCLVLLLADLLNFLLFVLFSVIASSL